MIIRKLKLKNIRSYEEIELNFSEGSTLLSGEIGAGKTSILLGLQFALFGLQPGQRGSSLLRQGENQAYAKIIFEIDGQTIQLERTIKKSKTGSITQDKNILTTDGQIHEISTLEMKNKVMQYLNYPKEFAKKANLLYKYTIYTPQEEMKSIILERPEIRLDTIRHIFGIDRYKKIQDNTKIFLQKIKESIKIKEILIGELSLLKEKLNNLNETKIKLAKDTNNLNIEKNLLTLKKEELEKDIKDKQDKINIIQQEMTNIETQKATLEQKQIMENRLKKDIVLMQKQITNKVYFTPEKLNDITEILSNHQKLLDDKNQEYIEINSQVLSLQSQKEKPQILTEKIMLMDNCPTCLQNVTQEHKTKMAKKNQYKLDDINRELDDKLVKKDRLIKEIDKSKQVIREYEEDRNELQQNKIKFEHQQEISIKIKSETFNLDRTTNEVKQLEESIKTTQTKTENFEEIKSNYDKIKFEFLNVNKNLRFSEIKYAEKNKELELLKIRLEDLKKDILKKDTLREQIILLRNLQDWITDKFLSVITITEKNVLTKIRTEFSSILSNWFNTLVDEPISVRLDENFTPIITNQDYEIDYEFLSGGERTAVALAYRLALNQVLNSILSKIKTKDIVILDEPTDGFATEQIDKMRDIFEQLNAKQTIIVSHEQKIEGFVDHILKVQKDFSSKIEKIES